MSKVIYDFGMNNGDDVEYYLKKDLKVVGVEANPQLCAVCAERFADSINNGQLTILNVALAGQSSSEQITFYVHKTNHVLSQVPKPDPSWIADFEPIQVSQKRASDIVIEHGPPHYIKIDLERMDHVIIADLFGSGIFPDFISAESHSVDTFALFVCHGYDSFNLVDGASVHKIYANAKIATPRGKMEHSFKHHSAGPFGEDIISPWNDKNSFLYVLALAGLGWKDIHASKVINPKLNSQISMRHFKLASAMLELAARRS
jgi:FkbM family methyltransferase